ncbi:MAG: hypothetical protein V7K48_03710 [Nostoc sp.]|uniref:hypothetical protein n=1 Tax=Nostoc sp. TaxID=1180 RepID=UPI002FFCC407
MTTKTLLRRSKRTHSGSKLRVASLRVAMPQALHYAIGNWRIILTLLFRATASFHGDAASFIYYSLIY